MDSVTRGSAEDSPQGSAHAAPKPAAPLDVEALLRRLETQSNAVKEQDLHARELQGGDAHTPEESVGGSQIDSSKIDENISTLELIHAQLTRDLNRARA